MTPDHEALRELAVAYAFGTLDADEYRLFEAHLSACSECQEDVLSAARLSEALAQVPERQLPSHLRSIVLHAATSAPTTQPARIVLATSPGRVRAPWIAIAASLMVLVTAGAAWRVHHQSTLAWAEAARGRQQAAAAEQALAGAQATADAAQRAVEIATAADVARVSLTGQPAAPQAAGRAFWSASRGLLFTGTRLPPLPPGRVYQLWYVTAASPVSAALVSPDASGEVHSVSPPSPQVRPKAFALTIEPAGGVPAPTGAFYLLGSL